MNVSGVIDTAIVLIAIYLALSFIVSNIYEQIAALMHLRGNMLYNSVLRLVMENEGLADAIFSHPNIVSSASDWGAQAKRPALQKGTSADPTQKSARPSYVDPRDFSIAFWQVLASGTFDPKGTWTPPDWSTLPDVDGFLASANDTLSKLPNRLGVPLTAIVKEADGHYEKLLDATDAWFNRQMDRVEGWYKRRAQYFIALIAAVVVYLLGVDSVRISSALYANEPIRTQLVQSIRVAMSPTPAASTAPSPAPPASPPPPVKALGDHASSVMSLLDDPSFVNVFVSGPVPDKSHPYVHIGGEVLTFLAVMLGAPFWFAVLGKLVNLRLAGTKPDADKDTKAK